MEKKILTYFHFGIIKGLRTIYSRVCSSSCPLLPPCPALVGVRVLVGALTPLPILLYSDCD